LTETVLSVRDLHVSFRTDAGVVQAVRGVSFDLAPGEILGIVGESGSGKSTVAMALTALNRTPNATLAGTVEHGGRDLLTLDEAMLQKVRGAQVAMIFQDPMTALTPVHTVGKLIAEVVRAHESCTKAQAWGRAVSMLQDVGINDAESRAKDYPHEFSGGMRQRVMIAMALACQPSVLVADEPTTALDVTIQAQILRLIRRLRAEHRTAVVLITHDLGVVAQAADRVGVMYAGRWVEEATVDELFAHPRHPYTRGLLASVPRLDRPRAKLLEAIPGSPPSMTEPDAGCAFRPRCPLAAEVCAQKPELIDRGGGPAHRDACFRSAEAEAGAVFTEVSG